jgi:beta-glucosidase
MPALAWGLEDLDLGGRIRAALDAGIDQFGGESCTDALVALVEQGLVAEERLDVSARRLLAAKFALGLFDDPYTDPDRADRIVGSAQGQAAGAAAQRRSVVVLKNDGGLLPLREGQPVRRVAFEPGRSAPAVEPGSGAPDTVTFLRTAAPFEPREQGFERFHHAGRLDFAPDELAALLEVLRKPSVLAIELDRPAVIPELLAQATAVVAFCGASDEVLADVIFGRASPEGRLPFDLPKSMAAVRRHPSDQPGGFEDPLLPMGWGLRVVSD